MKVDVCIPTYKPGKDFYRLMHRLSVQSEKISSIRIINTGKEYWQDNFVEEPLDNDINVTVEHITPDEFDHGAVRDRMMRASDADYVLFMTQDALPADRSLLKNLLDAFEEEKVAASYARQLPKPGCAPLEKQSRLFNYPDVSRIKSADDLEKLGIKTFFCSNVCAMYRREVYLKLKGFPKKTIFNEDMIFANSLIKNGYSIAYCADARVYHSHNYTLAQYFRRSFDMAVSQAMHPEVFAGISSESEGIKLVKAVSDRLLSRGDIVGEIKFIFQCGVKYMGYFCGKNYRKLPEKLVVICSDNKHFWNNR